MRTRRVRWLIAVVALMTAVAAPAAWAVSVDPEGSPRVASAVDTDRPVRSCASLALVTFPDGSRVTNAVDVPATGTGPAHCSVTVLVPNRINVVVHLPTTTWNGRYMAAGGGGYNGSPAGEIKGIPAALAQGYATSSTDSGHVGTPLTGEWAWSPTGLDHAAIQDFAHRASHEMAVKTKQVIELFYGRGPTYSYWNGCSSGGREGLTEAMRYPTDFDGIVALSPAINLTRMVPAMMWPPLVMKWMNHYLPACKESTLRQAVTAACGSTGDGAPDGLIDPRDCTFDARQLIGVETPCGAFTAADAAVINEIWRGPRGANGEFLWYGLEPWTDIGTGVPFVAGATVSAPPGTVPSDAAVDAIPASISEDWFKYFIHEDPSWNWRTETYEQYLKDLETSVRKWAPLFPDDPHLDAFRANGGKLIIWHGFADQLIPPRGTIDYYDRVVRAMGGLTKTTSFARLFLSPNSPHCGTQGVTEPNIGPYPTDPLAAVVAWRERGVTPATLSGSGTDATGRPLTRNICTYPQRMRYTGTGDVLRASSFTCTGASPKHSVTRR